MRRTPSLRESLFNYDKTGEMLAASIEDALKNGLSDDWHVEPVLCRRHSSDAWQTLTCKVINIKNGGTLQREFSFMEFKLLDTVVNALNLEIAILTISQIYPECKIVRADIPKNIISVQSKINIFPNDFKVLSECYNTETGTFLLRKFAKFAKLGINCEALPETFISPLLLDIEKVKRGCDNKHVLYSDLDPGYGNAVYITGTEPLPGNWVTATRMNYVQGKWRYTLPVGVSDAEGKCLTGPFIPDQKEVKVSELQYENLEGNRRIEFPAPSPRIN